MPGHDLSHAVTAHVAATADRAFAFMADPVRLGRWSLGCMDLVEVGGGVHSGRSLFDGALGFLSIEADRPRWTIDYHVGPKDALKPRISARVVPGPVCGLGEDACYVTLIAWRDAAMGEERWRRLVATHEAEIWLIKAQIETAERG